MAKIRVSELLAPADLGAHQHVYMGWRVGSLSPEAAEPALGLPIPILSVLTCSSYVCPFFHTFLSLLCLAPSRYRLELSATVSGT